MSPDKRLPIQFESQLMNAGDGVTDDTQGVQTAIDENIGKIIFADAGTYILTDTVLLPPGTRIVGETWTQFAAYGEKFSDVT